MFVKEQLLAVGAGFRLIAHGILPQTRLCGRPGAAVYNLRPVPISHFKTYFQGHLESTHVVWEAQESPPFSKGGQGGLIERLIIPLNPPLGKGDFKPPFPALPRLRKFLEPWPGFEIGSRHISLKYVRSGAPASLVYRITIAQNYLKNLFCFIFRAHHVTRQQALHGAAACELHAVTFR